MEQQISNSTEQNEGVTAPVLPGAMLKEARERLGLSVADAADQTKLAPRQIEALEADDYAHLPEMAFVRGFVRSYAKILHLDPQPLLALLPQAIASGAAQVTRSSVEVPFPNAHSPRVQNLIWLGAALLLSVLVVVFAVWHYTSPLSEAEPRQVQPVETAIPLPAEARVVSASDVAKRTLPHPLLPSQRRWRRLCQPRR
jgi:cytoskeleton protein RodZ